jgi:hypothetical protein
MDKKPNPKHLWKTLGDIPINDNEDIEEPFLHFPIGTNRLDIWHWFEDTFDIRVYDLMFPSK